MNTEHSTEGEGGHVPHDHFVEVSISTTAGFFPTEGFSRVPVNQKVDIELQKAKEALKIKDTAGWVASVITPTGKRPVDPAKSYAENGLSGELEIDWGPSEGRWLMHPAAAKALFDADVATLTQALGKRRGWTFHSLVFPMVDCSFTAQGRTPLRLQLMCVDWNELPPEISLHNADGTLLTMPQANPTGVFNGSPHPVANRQFICMRGSREYHTHPSHVGDPWENLRGHSNYTIGGILTQIWNAWLKGSG